MHSHFSVGHFTLFALIGLFTLYGVAVFARTLISAVFTRRSQFMRPRRLLACGWLIPIAILCLMIFSLRAAHGRRMVYSSPVTFARRAVPVGRKTVGPLFHGFRKERIQRPAEAGVDFAIDPEASTEEIDSEPPAPELSSLAPAATVEKPGSELAPTTTSPAPVAATAPAAAPKTASAAPSKAAAAAPPVAAPAAAAALAPGSVPAKKPTASNAETVSDKSKPPAWIDEKPQEDKAHRLVVAVGPIEATPEKAESAAVAVAVKLVRDDFVERFPQSRHWLLPVPEVRSQAVRRVHVQPIDRTTSTSGTHFRVYRGYCQVELSEAIRGQLYPLWKKSILGDRLRDLAGLVGLLTLTVGIGAAYFRLDARTAGHYRSRLRLAALALIAAGGGAAAYLL